MSEIAKKKLFLASSAELSEDRTAFEIFVNRKNREWIDKGVFVDLVVWEDFLDAMSRTRLQDEYNKAIRGCDLFVLLFWHKVGRYTREEFETAFGQFRATDKPFIFTYFKDTRDAPGSVDPADFASLQAFQARLDALGHFYTRYPNVEGLQLHFNRQLDKLVANGFIEFQPERAEPPGSRYEAHLAGGGVIAQGAGATAAGSGAVVVKGGNSGTINTGTLVDTGGGPYVGGNVNAGGDFIGRDKITQGVDAQMLDRLFAPLLAAVAQHAAAEKQDEAIRQLNDVQTEVAKGTRAEDHRLGRLIDGLADLVPGAVGAVVKTFATPLLDGIVGPVTRYVLEKLKGG